MHALTNACLQLDKSIVILCASLTEPWNIIDTLRRWADVLEARMTALDENNKTEMRDARDRRKLCALQGGIIGMCTYRDALLARVR